MIPLGDVAKIAVRQDAADSCSRFGLLKSVASVEVFWLFKSFGIEKKVLRPTELFVAKIDGDARITGVGLLPPNPSRARREGTTERQKKSS